MGSGPSGWDPTLPALYPLLLVDPCEIIKSLLEIKCHRKPQDSAGSPPETQSPTPNSAVNGVIKELSFPQFYICSPSEGRSACLVAFRDLSLPMARKKFGADDHRLSCGEKRQALRENIPL